MENVKGFLDGDGKIKLWASKHDKKRAILNYLATKFELGIDYNEKQVNQIISEWHTFNDYFLLRRELVESKMLLRTVDCGRYWKNNSYVFEDSEDSGDSF